MTDEHLQVVWLKRDLRLADHRPLFTAAQHGPALILYVAEPSIWCAGDLSVRHLQFVAESLHDLEAELSQRGAFLCTAIAEIEHVLQTIYDVCGPFTLLAHEENGTPHTFARDLRVHQWMRERGLAFIEYQHFGVTRRLKSREQFQQKWEQFMALARVPIPEHIAVPSPDTMARLLADGVIRRGVHIQHLTGIPGTLTVSSESQRGGEQWAQATLADFFAQRAATYQFHLSKPYESMRSCARISTYLAWGNLSIREVVQRTRAQLRQSSASHRRHLEAFLSRLHWHCHFIQRIEDAPHLAHTTMNPAFEGIRQLDDQNLQAWWLGQTGFPAVDAAMRSLHRTGWLHFRGRAMVVSFVCNTLLLDWRAPAQLLAQLFLDYEPGIHYSQVQMQAGTTGFNTIRIYNPIKQSEEHDPQGRFIKMFIPELRSLPSQQLHEPWKWIDPTSLGYPQPIVDLTAANRTARDVLWGTRKAAKRADVTQELLQRHGSRTHSGRRSTARQTQTSTTHPQGAEQLTFDFDFEG